MMGTRWTLIVMTTLLALPTSWAAPKPGDAVAALENYAFTRTGDELNRRGIRTDAVVILQHGAIIYEHYARGYSASKRHISWSVAKSVINAMTAVSVRLGRISLSDSICKFIKSADPAKCGITIDHLLHLSSGVDWNENYDSSDPEGSTVLGMLYGDGHVDMAKFVLSRPLKVAPGRRWNYSTGDATLLASVLKGAWGSEYPNVFWRELFNPLEMTSARWERDQTDSLIGGSYFYATARDYARFGTLFLNDGAWSGKRLLPEGWVKFSTQIAPAALNPETDLTNESAPGALWWINKPVPQKNSPKPFPDLPDDAFAAIGHWGQSITVMPSQDAVVVRLGDDRDDSFDLATFLKLAKGVIQ
jgi:CubicO group peptidase (beta-lactamase class C family)